MKLEITNKQADYLIMIIENSLKNKNLDITMIHDLYSQLLILSKN